MPKSSPACVRVAVVLAAAVASSAAVLAAPLTPSSGGLRATGTLDNGGRFEVQATLQGGTFRGQLSLTSAGQTITAPLVDKRSYFENGKCYFRAEQGRARAEVGGKCDSAAFEGRFDAFFPGQGASAGTAKGAITLTGGGTPAAAGQLPTARLTCAYQDRKFSAKLGGATQYSLAFSNMKSLALTGSRYATATGSGSFQRVGADKIRLTSGPWKDAVGTLEPDRSGRPAVVFHIEENRRADGVHVVDPYTTHCTEARS